MERNRTPCLIESLAPDDAEAAIPALAEILVEGVDDGGGMTFNAPLALDVAVGFWRQIMARLPTKDRILLVARDPETREILGTIQVIPAQIENQRHRAEVVKMAVRRSARRRGIAAQLMRSAESAAKDAGIRLLTLDTVTGSAAEQFYERMGWIRIGEIPEFAYNVNGSLLPASIFYKLLR